MLLFEATWPDTPSLLLSAYTAGEALHYIRQSLGAHRLYQLDELTEIKRSNYVLVLQCGKVHSALPPEAFAYCPKSPVRLFMVESLSGDTGSYGLPGRRARALFVVEELNQLPSLVLWHYDQVSEEDSLDEDLVGELWMSASDNYHILEVDTSRQGVLLSYDYCSCDTADVERRPELRELDRD